MAADDAYIPYGRQTIDARDVESVVRVLTSDFLTQGPAIEAFEQAVAAYCDVPYAVAVSSATAGLHLACLAVGLGPGDWLWTSPNTFVATANAALYCGAQVDFVDIDPQTYNLDVGKLAEKLAVAAASGRLPKALAPVHFAGQSCAMRAIGQLAAHYGVSIIEDAAHAVGGRYEQRPIGDCAYSQMAVFSFHPVKIITTGEGGVVTTRDQRLYERLKSLRSHGITRDPAQMTRAPHGPWDYQQLALGFNYRMTDLQAALGLSQMARLDEFVLRRQALARRYDEKLAHLPLTLPWQDPAGASSFHLYVVRLKDAAHRRREVFESLRAAAIGVNVHYIPVHTQPYYRAMGFQHGDFPQAEAYYGEAITLPLYFGLSEADQDRVVAALQTALERVGV